MSHILDAHNLVFNSSTNGATGLFNNIGYASTDISDITGGCVKILNSLTDGTTGIHNRGGLTKQRYTGTNEPKITVCSIVDCSGGTVGGTKMTNVVSGVHLKSPVKISARRPEKFFQGVAGPFISTVPVGATRACVKLMGGGGGGNYGKESGGGGGGAGSLIENYCFSVVNVDSISGYVGEGGTGGYAIADSSFILAEDGVASTLNLPNTLILTAFAGAGGQGTVGGGGGGSNGSAFSQSGGHGNVSPYNAGVEGANGGDGGGAKQAGQVGSAALFIRAGGGGGSVGTMGASFIGVNGSVGGNSPTVNSGGGGAGGYLGKGGDGGSDNGSSGIGYGSGGGAGGTSDIGSTGGNGRNGFVQIDYYF